MRQVHDIIAFDLEIVFVAINPPTPSARMARPFASPSNMFWRLVHESGLTGRRYRPEDARLLPDEGLGLVSLVARPTRAAANLRTRELRAGARRLTTTIAHWRPKTIALLGLTLLPFVLPGTTEPGAGAKRTTFAGARVFVLPNPSGRNRSYPGFSGKIEWYRELATLVGRRAARP